MRILVLSSDLPSRPGWWPPEPLGFLEFKDEIERQLGIRLDIRTRLPLGQFWPLIGDERPDVVFLLISWDYPASGFLSALDDLRRSPSAPSVVFLDQADQSSSPFLEVLPHVDLFLKSQVLRDREAYTRIAGSGYVFTEFLSKELGYDLQGWEAGSTDADPRHLSKMLPGWNLGVSPQVRSLLRLSRIASIPWRARPFDLNRRLGFGKDNDVGWYATYRRFANQALGRATCGLRCTGDTRVSRRRYLLEMACSRLIFSPFGWGEVCVRDFEAVALGALLVKPSMDHLATNPDIYVPYETYVPVRWDLSDLEERCRWCLAHPAESSKMASNARRALGDYFARGGFVKDVQRTLARLGRD